MEIETLLKQVSEDSPCGPDLAYDPEFVSLEHTSHGKPERRIGETVVPAQEPDWTEVKQRAEELFSRTKDLRVAILLVRALTHCEGMVGFTSGLELVYRMLAADWEHVHPCLDTDDGDDPTMRLNVLASLADPEGLVRDLRSTKFIFASHHVRLSLRDILVALEKLSATGNETVLSQSEIGEIMRAPENAESAKAIRDTLNTLKNIQVLLSEKVGTERAPNFQLLYDTLTPMMPMINQLPDSAMTDVPTDSTEIQSNERDKFASFEGEIRTREDVIQMLEKICKFIERTEPANPASLLIRRAQSLMTKNFVEIIKDLAPGSLEQILNITGLDSEKK
ncbi:type VI secretion system protein TssA [Nitrosomonas communis]|uniref:Type VI secretion system protein ImpA n=1 Tax=Nitrosomonas communis TaxID=44574 RepID=A0A1H2V3R9_9PROT|nr:type VI secretion system protein TssA [Nitrosomonas communis]SDW62599.1 type VI secretion system protein ImpA [Nitrosomonas communis]